VKASGFSERVPLMFDFSTKTRCCSESKLFNPAQSSLEMAVLVRMAFDGQVE